MLKIGDFSKLSRVSIRMLRHYDDIGLLKPAEIDEFTGYRYYQEEQLFIMGRITALKDMGFALADIVKILVSDPMFNIYHVSPAQIQNPEEYMTEVCFPIG